MQQGGMEGGPMGGGPQVLRLNVEQMAAMDRLTEMGFDRAEAALAFLACDNNEALAAKGGAFGFCDEGNNGDDKDMDGYDMYD